MAVAGYMAFWLIAWVVFFSNVQKIADNSDIMVEQLAIIEHNTDKIDLRMRLERLDELQKELEAQKQIEDLLDDLLQDGLDNGLYDMPYYKPDNFRSDADKTNDNPRILM
jgi:hypothetical protein